MPNSFTDLKALDTLKLSAFEEYVFSATSRTEKDLLELGSKCKDTAINLWLNIPTGSSDTAKDLVILAGLLESEYNVEDALKMVSIYSSACVESWEKSFGAVFDRIAEENQAKSSINEYVPMEHIKKIVSLL